VLLKLQCWLPGSQPIQGCPTPTDAAASGPKLIIRLAAETASIDDRCAD